MRLNLRLIRFTGFTLLSVGGFALLMLFGFASHGEEKQDCVKFKSIAALNSDALTTSLSQQEFNSIRTHDQAHQLQKCLRSLVAESHWQKKNESTIAAAVDLEVKLFQKWDQQSKPHITTTQVSTVE